MFLLIHWIAFSVEEQLMTTYIARLIVFYKQSKKQTLSLLFSDIINFAEVCSSVCPFILTIIHSRKLNKFLVEKLLFTSALSLLTFKYYRLVLQQFLNNIFILARHTFFVCSFPSFRMNVQISPSFTFEFQLFHSIEFCGRSVYLTFLTFEKCTIQVRWIRVIVVTFAS